MSIAEDLKPFEKELNLYKSHNALPQGEVKGALADIYEKYYPQNRHWGVSKPNRSCPSCVSDFMKCLVAEWNNRPTVEFKGVPQKKGIDTSLTGDLIGSALREEIRRRNSNNGEDTTQPIPDYVKPPEIVYSMKWGAFKTYCKEQGLKVHGKKRAELTKELGL